MLGKDIEWAVVCCLSACVSPNANVESYPKVKHLEVGPVKDDWSLGRALEHGISV